MLHYAGNVQYNVDGFIIKNKNTLNADVTRTMLLSDNIVLRNLFDEDYSMTINSGFFFPFFDPFDSHSLVPEQEAKRNANKPQPQPQPQSQPTRAAFGRSLTGPGNRNAVNNKGDKATTNKTTVMTQFKR